MTYSQIKPFYFHDSTEEQIRELSFILILPMSQDTE